MLGTVATTGRRYIFDLPVISVKIFESQCMTTKSKLISENLDFIEVTLSLHNISRALLTGDRLRMKSFMFKDRAFNKAVII